MNLKLFKKQKGPVLKQALGVFYSRFFQQSSNESLYSASTPSL
jgi:hypothetical protein